MTDINTGGEQHTASVRSLCSNRPQQLSSCEMACVSRVIAAILLVAAFSVYVAAGHGNSHTSLHNGLGFYYKYDIDHAPHGHWHGASHPNGYGGFGAPGYHVGGGRYDGY